MTGGRSALKFPRARRLDGAHAFSAVLAGKCRAVGEWFQVYALPNAGEGARLGVTVSKRVMKTAVARNRCKRVVREVFRNACAQLPGCDFVVRPRAPFQDASRARRELDELLRRAALLSAGRRPAAQIP